MISINMVTQIVFVLGVYSKKNWKVKTKEALICLFFLRPAVDAFRVSTNHKDAETTVDSLGEMLINKVRRHNVRYFAPLSKCYYWGPNLGWCVCVGRGVG